MSEIPTEKPGQGGRERREAPRFFFLSRADVKVAGHLDPYWGSVLNISRTGVSLQIRQNLQLNATVTVSLHFMSEQEKEAVEVLTAKVVWKTGENAGLKFESPLTESSPIARRVPRLMEHLQKRA
jgi:hypothetical protein